MIKIVRGVTIAVSMAGIVMGLPNGGAAVAQAPTQSVISIDGTSAIDEGSQLELLPNPVLRNEEQQDAAAVQAFALQQEAKEKIATLAASRSLRVQEEKIRAEKLRKKRLAEKRRRAEAKRRKEIQACCGVAAGTSDQRILERIVEAEAGGEDFKGRLLVANVVLNRVKHKAFPSSIRGVVFAHRGSRYQFSPISDGRYYTVSVTKGTKKAVNAALQGKDPSQGALYFMERSYADSGNVRWFDRSLTRLFRYGCHEFFR